MNAVEPKTILEQQSSITGFTVLERAVLYARVSGDDSKHEGRNIKSQLDSCREYASGKGYNVIEQKHEDEKKHTSGYEIDLPELNKIRELARNGRFDVLIVREMDRLSRSLAKQLIIEEELKRAGVRIEYVLAEYNDSPEGMLSKNIRAVVAEYEREKIKERMVRGRRLKVESGKVIANFAPYGYRLTLDGNNFEIYEPEAQIVRLIFDFYIREGLSLIGIATKLNKMEIPTAKQSKGWTMWLVSNILENETYAGIWHYGKTYITTVTNEKGRQVKKRVQNPKEKWIAVNVPAIVDTTIFEDAKAKRQENKIMAARNIRFDYLLAKRLDCKHCNESVRAGNSRGKSGVYHYYQCKNWVDYKTCNLPSFRADKLDAKVWEWIKSLLEDEENLKKKLEQYKTNQETQNKPLLDRLGIIDSLLAENRKKQERLLDQAVAGLFDEEMITERKRNLDTTKNSLEKERGELITQLERVALTVEQAQEILTIAAKIRQGIAKADKDFKARRKLIQILNVRASLEFIEGKKKIHARCILDEKTLLFDSITIYDNIKCCN